MNAVLMSHAKKQHEVQKEDHATYSALGQRQYTSRFMESKAFNKSLEYDGKVTGLREWFKKTSGLQTVQKWVSNYHAHPAGWGALLLIHGIPEVTGRLRTKVDNFAIYSALFLASAIAALIAPPDKITSCDGGFECELRKRIFFYCLIIGVVSQILCIMLAMAFGNALNEAARDCDVFRMFSPAGNGFKATKKCEMAYITGVGATFVAMLAAVQCYMGWEALIVSLVSTAVGLNIYWSTANALFTSAGIVDYWKTGNVPGDPYDLDVLVQAFAQQAKGAHEIWDDLESAERGTLSQESTGRLCGMEFDQLLYADR